MIISYKHNFIFVKTHKTAGTTVQVILGKMLYGNAGPDDVVTPIRPIEQPMLDKERPYRPMNGGEWEPHTTSANIISVIGREKFDSMFTFCFERNPWEKVVSWYLFHIKVGKVVDKDFETWFHDIFVVYRNKYPGWPGATDPCDWYMYTMNDEVVVDYIGRWETLQKDFEKICRIIGLEFDGIWPYMKKNDWDRNYKKYYRPWMVDLVADIFHKEVEAFQYDY